jgi:hypothetical protein
MKKQYLAEYYNTNTEVLMTARVTGEDKTDARDTFFKLFPCQNNLIRLTWIPSSEKQHDCT